MAASSQSDKSQMQGNRKEENTYLFQQALALARASKEANTCFCEAKWRLQNLEEMVEISKRNMKKMMDLKKTLEKLSREAAAVVLKMSCNATFEEAFKDYRDNLNVSFSEFMILADTLSGYNSESDDEYQASTPKRRTPTKYHAKEGYASKWRSHKGLQSRSSSFSSKTPAERCWSNPSVSKTNDFTEDFMSYLADKQSSSRTRQPNVDISSRKKGSSTVDSIETFPRMSSSDYKDQMVKAIESTHSNKEISPLWEDRYIADVEDDSDKESYTSKKQQRQSQLVQEYNLRPGNSSEEETNFANRAMNATWQQIQREMIEYTSKRKEEDMKKQMETHSSEDENDVEIQSTSARTNAGLMAKCLEVTDKTTKGQKLIPKSRNQPTVSPLLNKEEAKAYFLKEDSKSPTQGKGKQLFQP